MVECIDEIEKHGIAGDETVLPDGFDGGRLRRFHLIVCCDRLNGIFNIDLQAAAEIEEIDCKLNQDARSVDSDLRKADRTLMGECGGDEAQGGQ